MAELVYDIDLNVRKALKGIDDLQGKLKKTNSVAAKTGKTFGKLKGVLAGLSLVGFGALVKSSLNSADALGKVANKTGFAVTALQELRFAAEQSGIAQNALDTSLQRFSRRVGEAANGTGVLAKDLTAMGISIKDSDGSMRNINDVFNDYMRGISGATSEQEKLRLAIAAFDMEGGNMVNMLQNGTAGFMAMRKEARDLGAIVDKNTIKKATEANDAWGRVKAQFQAITTIAVANLAPALKNIADHISEMLKDKDQVERISEGFKAFGGSLEYVMTNLDGVMSAIKGVLITFGTFSVGKGLKVFEKLGKSLRNLWRFELAGVSLGLKKIGTWFAGALAPTLGFLGSLTAIAATLWGIAEAISAVISKANAAENMTGIPQARGSEDELRKKRLELIKKGQMLFDKIPRFRAGAELDNLNPAVKAKNLTDIQKSYAEALRATAKEFLPLKTATTEYENNVWKLQLALKEGFITQKEHATAMQNLKNQYKEFLDSMSAKEARTWTQGWVEAFRLYKDAAFNSAAGAKNAFFNATWAMEDAIVAFARTGKLTMANMVDGIISDMLRIQSRKLIANIFTGAGNIGNNFAGFFAHGGTIPAGKYGVAGEAGPELISGPAQVTPMGNTQVTYNINAVDAPSFENLLARDPTLIYALTEQGRRGLPSYA